MVLATVCRGWAGVEVRRIQRLFQGLLEQGGQWAQPLLGEAEDGIGLVAGRCLLYLPVIVILIGEIIQRCQAGLLLEHGDGVLVSLLLGHRQPLLGGALRPGVVAQLA